MRSMPCGTREEAEAAARQLAALTGREYIVVESPKGSGRFYPRVKGGSGLR